MMRLKDTHAPGATVVKTRAKNKKQTVIPQKHRTAANTKLPCRCNTRKEDKENTLFETAMLKP
jgi:hypothetical protein